MDFVQILQTGISGLAFLLAYLAYKLIRNSNLKSDKKAPPALYVYMAFVFALSIVCLTPYFIDYKSHDNEEIVRLKDTIAELKSELEQSKLKETSVVFQKVCNQQRFKCRDQITAESKDHDWRAMTPTEIQVCNLACE